MALRFKITNSKAPVQNAVAYFGGVNAANTVLGTAFDLHFSNALAVLANLRDVSTGDLIVLFQEIHGFSRCVSHVVQVIDSAVRKVAGDFPNVIKVSSVARLDPYWFAQNGQLQHDGVRIAGNAPPNRIGQVNSLLVRGDPPQTHPSGGVVDDGAPYSEYYGYRIEPERLLRRLALQPSNPKVPRYYECVGDIAELVRSAAAAR